MSEKIKAFVVNRNLLSTLKSTVEFLQKEERVEIVIFDQCSTYPPLLKWYKTCGLKILYNENNDGPHSIWRFKEAFNNEYFILADSDCTYEGIPSDWLNRMSDVLVNSSAFKVGFSLRIDDLPKHSLSKHVKNVETQYWQTQNSYGYVAHIDTTFALYRPHSGFTYDAIRLAPPYTIKHVMWYLRKDRLSKEWQYYINNASHVSTWGAHFKTNKI